MQVRRKFIIAFLIVSVIAVYDVVQTGVTSFGRVFDQTFGQVDTSPIKEVPDVPPDYEVRRELQPVPGTNRVVVDKTYGRLEVFETESDQLMAEYVVKTWGPGDGERYARAVELRWVQEDGVSRLVLERPSSLPSRIRDALIEVTLKVPEGLELEVAHIGDANVTGLSGTLALDHSSGNARVARVRGPVMISSRFSRLEALDIGDRLDLAHSAGQVVVRGVDGPVTGSMQFGDITVQSVSGDVEMSVSQGSGMFGRIGGEVKLSAGFGDVTLEDVAGHIGLDVRMGAAEVSNLTAGADLSVQYGDIEVSLAEGGGWYVEGVAEMGGIETPFGLDRRTTAGTRVEVSGVIGDGAHALNIDARQGSVRIVQ